MSNGTNPASDTVKLLRDGFDQSFVAPHAQRLPVDDFLEIGFGDGACALRTSEISGVFVDRDLTTLPTPLPELLGLTGVRGAILPVYHLGALLGYAMQETTPRWLVLAAAEPVALAFERFEGHVRVAQGAIVSRERDDRRMQHVRELIQTPDRILPVVSVVSVLEAIRNSVGRHGAPTEER